MEQESKKPFSAQLTLAIATFVFLLLAGWTLHKNLYQTENSSENISPDKQVSATTSEPEDPLPEIPDSYQLAVPFTAQAPTANWDKLHNEACEEASAIIAHAYFSGLSELTPKYVESEIKKLTKWQTDNYGYYLSISTQETARMIKDVYELEASVVPLSQEAIKKALTENKLVIFPANGQLLKNPYYQSPGPIYHMLVITGYDDDTFITNDPGTKRGKDYRYKFETLSKAGGGWSHLLSAVDLDRKEIIIVNK